MSNDRDEKKKKKKKNFFQFQIHFKKKKICLHPKKEEVVSFMKPRSNLRTMLGNHYYQFETSSCDDEQVLTFARRFLAAIPEDEAVENISKQEQLEIAWSRFRLAKARIPFREVRGPLWRMQQEDSRARNHTNYFNERRIVRFQHTEHHCEFTYTEGYGSDTPPNARRNARANKRSSGAMMKKVHHQVVRWYQRTLRSESSVFRSQSEKREHFLKNNDDDPRLQWTLSWTALSGRRLGIWSISLTDSCLTWESSPTWLMVTNDGNFI